MSRDLTDEEATALAESAYWSIQFLKYGWRPTAKLAELRAIPGWSETNDARIASLESGRQKLRSKR